MAENEIEIKLAAGLPPVLPVTAEVSVGYKRRWLGRGSEVASSLAAAVGGPDKLEQRASESEEIDSLINRAVIIGANSDLHEKRVLLAQVVARAVLDDAEIDESILLVNALADIDAVHVRSLESIRRAEAAAVESGEMEPISRGAEKPITREVQAAVEKLSEIVLRKLVSLNLIDGEVTWDGVSVITGLTSLGARILDDLAGAVPK